jgi:hypothetical protein
MSKMCICGPGWHLGCKQVPCIAYTDLAEYDREIEEQYKTDMFKQTLQYILNTYGNNYEKEP